MSSSPGQEGSSAKRAARQRLLSQRDGMTELERATASARIAASTLTVLDDRVSPGAIVALYCAKGSEVATTLIDAGARAAGLIVVYPRVTPGTTELTFHACELRDLVPGRFGLVEPPVEAALVRNPAIAAFVVPGVGFDHDGMRIGWGRGHYDVTLSRAPQGLRIGVAFEGQIMESVPSEAHDQRMHVIVTEHTVREIGA